MAYQTVTVHHKKYPWTSVMASPYNCDNTGILNCAAKLEDLKAYLSNVGEIFFPEGTYLISDDLTIPAGMIIRGPKAVINIAAGKTLTLNGPTFDDVPSFTIANTASLVINGAFNAGLRKVFTDSNAGYDGVVFGAGTVKEVCPEWWAVNTTPGTTDMTNALKAAINSITSTGGIVSLASTTYLISSQINLYSYTSVIGSGIKTIISYSGTGNATSITGGRSFAALKNFQLVGTASANAGIYMSGANHNIIENIWIKNFTAGKGLYLYGTAAGGCYYNQITKVTAGDPAGPNSYGIYLEGNAGNYVNANNFVTCRVDYNTNDGLYITNSTKNVFSGFTAEYNGGYGANLVGATFNELSSYFESNGGGGAGYDMNFSASGLVGSINNLCIIRQNGGLGGTYTKLTGANLYSGRNVILGGPISLSYADAYQLNLNQRANSTDVVLYTHWGNSITNYPFLIKADGQHEWGSGTAARDITLSRDASLGCVLKCSQSLCGLFLNLGVYTEATISGGVLTISRGHVLVEGEGSAADNLDTISITSGKGAVWDIVVLRSAGHAITVRHNIGNILLNGGTDKVLSSGYDTLILLRMADKFIQLSYSDNG